MEPAPEGPITCLFTDIEGSTQLSKGLHPEAWKQVATEHDRILRECIVAQGGVAERTEGDSFFATFPTATAALKCAVAMQEALHADGKPRLTVLKDGADVPLKVRIGVYLVTQEVYRTEQGAYRDHQVSLAQRTMDCGVGEMIVVNEEAYQAAHVYLDPNLTWRAWNNRLVKDIAVPQALYELLWDGDQPRKIRASLWIPSWFRRSEDTFVGRNDYLTRIERELKEGHRLVLIHGQGGIGKTRLALQIARRMDDHFHGCLFGVPFDGLKTSDQEKATVSDLEKVTVEQVAREIARALFAPDDLFNGLDPQKPDSYAERLVAYLSRRFLNEPFLLILDNFENANNSATRQLIGDLLKDTPSLRFLITCRMHFALSPYGYAIEIEGLPYPQNADQPLEEFEAYQLFRDRALICDPPPDLSDTDSILSILAYTEGSALGIELTAARVGMPLMSLKKIAVGLKVSRLKWQSADPDDTSAGAKRHESIDANIDWSFQLLPEAERRLYPRLSVFPADFSIESAQDIAGITEAVLVRWVRFHLLSAVGDRCLLSPVLREFAASRLSPTDAPDLTTRFIAYYIVFAQQNRDMNREEDRHILHTELRNLHTAANLLCATPTTAANAVNLIWFGLALWTVPTGVRSENLLKAIACYEAALRVYTEQAFPLDWAMTQNNLGNAYSTLPSGDRDANLRRAIACYEAALRVYTEQAFPQDWATNQNNLGNAYSDLPSGDRDANLGRSIACYEAALRVRTEQAFPQEWAGTQNNLGIAYRNLPSGDRDANLRKAIACFEAALRVYTEQAFPQNWANTQFNLALARKELGDQEGAQQAMQRAAEGYRLVGIEQEAQQAEAWLRRQRTVTEKPKGLLARLGCWLRRS